MSGCWVMVCGPSGAGKDSVLAWAREALEGHKRVCFARRLVTRPSLPGSEHEEISPSVMQSLRDAGGLAWHWHAHGFEYGIRARYGTRVEQGDVVVLNGSREHAQSVAERADVRVVLVTANAALVAQRLLQRGREQAEAIAARMDRNAALQAPAVDHVIDNGGALAHAGAALRDYLAGLVR